MAHDISLRRFILGLVIALPSLAAQDERESTQPVAQTPAVGANINLTLAASGPNLTYQWRKDGVAIAGATNATLNFPSVGLADAGAYTVFV